MRLMFTLLMLVLAAAAPAAPTRYVLEPDASTVGFSWDMGQDTINGTMPVSRADLSLDFARPGDSTIAVRLQVSRAKAGFPFATQAMRGPQVLDAANHPEIVFRSTRLRGDVSKARVDGQITVRGVTRPITLHAEIYRRRGADTGDLSRLSVLLTGQLSRSAFGASGFPNMVGDTVRLRILARIRRSDPQ